MRSTGWRRSIPSIRTATIGAPVERLKFDLGDDHEGRPCVSWATSTHADGRRRAYGDAPWLPYTADAPPGYPSGRYAIGPVAGIPTPIS